jgi:hypothetical protein
VPRCDATQQKKYSGREAEVKHVCTCSPPCFYTAGREVSQWRLQLQQGRCIGIGSSRHMHATTSSIKAKQSERLGGSTPVQHPLFCNPSKSRSVLISGSTGGHPQSKQQVPQSHSLSRLPCHGPCRLVTGGPRQDQRYCYPR